jgi:hypothetical protein
VLGSLVGCVPCLNMEGGNLSSTLHPSCRSYFSFLVRLGQWVKGLAVNNGGAETIFWIDLIITWLHYNSYKRLVYLKNMVNFFEKNIRVKIS